MFHGLPPELQVECLKWLGEAPGRDWLHCCLASRIMFELCHDAALWHYFCCCQKVEAEKGRGMAAGVKDWKQHYLHRIRLFSLSSVLYSLLFFFIFLLSSTIDGRACIQQTICGYPSGTNRVHSPSARTN
ncbi:hypothetical protein QOT17_013298 [Balamuthia mandrillaris]